MDLDDFFLDFRWLLEPERDETELAEDEEADEERRRLDLCLFLSDDRRGRGDLDRETCDAEETGDALEDADEEDDEREELLLRRLISRLLLSLLPGLTTMRLSEAAVAPSLHATFFELR